MGLTLLECFPKLLKDKKHERVDGALKLLQHLLQEVQVTILVNNNLYCTNLYFNIKINFYLLFNCTNNHTCSICIL
jgi:hypothetical protein